MSLLRIYCTLREAPQQCQWALVGDGREPVVGAGPLTQLPQRAERVQLVLSAAEVLITRARLPKSAKRQAGSMLTFAVEEDTLGDPEANQVSWLGFAKDADVLAVADLEGLKRWQKALEASGIQGYEVHCETLMLPWTAGEWSLAWDGRDGFVRTGEFEGTATDCGETASPPLSLRLMLDEAKSRGEAPASIAVYVIEPQAGSAISSAPVAPDIEAWQRALGVALRAAGVWDWRRAPPEAGISLAQERKRWRLAAGTMARLRPAAWIVGIAIALHTLALVGDWTRLASEQRRLRAQMETRFRTTFPDAIAVADPALQMRRKLAEPRHVVGQADAGDFLPMLGIVAAALKDLPAGGMRVASYEGGRMTIELAAVEDTAVRRIVGRLRQAGMHAEAALTRAGSGAVVITVRAS